MSLLKYFSNESRKESGPDTALASPSANEVELQPAKRQKIISKRRKWNEDFINYGFRRPIGEEENLYSSAQCLFCSTSFGNINVVKSKLLSHLTKQHPEHQNKCTKFFQSYLDAQKKQSHLFNKQMGHQVTQNKNMLLASLRMSHHMMKAKRPYTELERVVLPCLEIAAELIHGRKKAVDKIKQIPLSDTTVGRRCAILSEDLKQQLINKLLKAPSFSIQLDESTDITSEAQLMVFCRFPDAEAKRIVEHYLFCKPVGEKATAEAIFQKMNDFFEREGLDWSKCRAVTTDGAAAMQGSHTGVVKRIKQVSPKCVGIHCILHREALALKKLKLNASEVNGQENELSDVLREVVEIVNSIRKSAKQQRIFSKLCKELNASSKKLILHSEVRWLSQGKVLSRVFELRAEIETFCNECRNPRASKFSNIYWVAKLAYLASIFDRLNQVNLSLQGKGGDIFRSSSKVNALKLKIPLWKKHAASRNFNDFPLLSQYMKESEWEFEDASTEDNLSTLIVAHLNLLGDNLCAYFPEANDKRLEANSWIIQPFNEEPTEDEELLELRADLNQKIAFREMGYSDFWVYLLEFLEYKNLAKSAIDILVQMPTTYLCEEGFSNLVEIKSKKRNSILDIDSLMRGGIEKEITPRYLRIAETMQEQASH